MSTGIEAWGGRSTAPTSVPRRSRRTAAGVDEAVATARDLTMHSRRSCSALRGR